MKISFLFSILISSFFFLHPPYAPVTWQEEAIYDFGDITKGDTATAVFSFRNTGTDSLYIDNVRTACGCTSPDWADVLVPPDSLGFIHIEYDAEDSGYFSKWIKVYFNGYRKAERLSIEGYVEE